MQSGCILFDNKFKFHDGEDGKKFIILLGSHEGISLFVKTTSQSARYKLDFGCQVTHRFPNFHLVKGCCCLQKSTWVCLDEFYELAYGRILQKHYQQELVKFGDLPPEIIKQLLECSFNSEDITQNQKTIVELALKAVNSKL